MAGHGLVLEGGGMRGIFTAGVLDYFLDHNINFDTVIGVSAGACHACSYLSRQRERAYHTFVDYLNDPRYMGTQSLISTGDYFNADFSYRLIPEELMPYDYTAFDANPTRFYATVTNCLTGKAYYPLLRDMHTDVQWVRASASLPLLSRKVVRDDIPYLDGGIADSIPILKSLHLGNDKNVVVLTQVSGYCKNPNSLLPLIRVRYAEYPHLVEALEQRHLVYNQTLVRLKCLEAEGKAFVIRPQSELHVDRLERDKQKMRVSYEAGYNEALRRADALRAYLQD